HVTGVQTCALPIYALADLPPGTVVFIDSDQLAVNDGAGWQVRKRVCNISKFIVEGFLLAGKEIYPVGLDGNHSVTVDFYFPNPVRGVWKLRYGQAFHGLDERCIFLGQGYGLEFRRHARLHIPRSTSPQPAMPYQRKARPMLRRPV